MAKASRTPGVPGVPVDFPCASDTLPRYAKMGFGAIFCDFRVSAASHSSRHHTAGMEHIQTSLLQW